MKDKVNKFLEVENPVFIDFKRFVNENLTL